MRNIIANVWIVFIAILHAIPGQMFKRFHFRLLLIDKLIHYIYDWGFLYAIVLNHNKKHNFYVI